VTVRTVTPPSPDVARRLREFLAESGYSDAGLQKHVGISKPPLQQFGLLDRLLDETQEPTALNLLIRWFFLSRPVAERDARDSLPAWFVEDCREHGLLEACGDELQATCLLTPCGETLIAADLYAKLNSPERYDHVLSINPAAFNLLHFTVRREIDRLLDLGAGCGVQALVAACHARAVVATDLNSRASRYLQFNARLNGIDNIEILTGDLFEPVQGRTFDHIVSNPPFVLAPSREFLYRDNAMELDGFCRRLAREVPAHLAEGGIFQMICEWVEIEGQDWRERIGEWFHELPCDTWVMKSNVQEPSGYAEGRIRETFPPSDEAASQTFRTWMDYYRKSKVRAIHGGMVTMRRRTGANWVRLEDCPGTVHGPFGEFVLAGLRHRDFLASHPSEEGMLDAKPTIADRALLETQARWVDGAWQPVAMRLTSADGLRQTIRLEGEVAQFLGQLSGDRTLGELIRELASRVEVEPERVRTECVGMARLLLERGFLTI
jgi:hypothetical protein